MAWKDIVKVDLFDMDLDFMNVTPRMKATAARMKTPEMKKLKNIQNAIEKALNDYDEAADGIYDIINPLNNLGVLKEEDVLSFTKVIDELEMKIKDADYELAREIERKMRGD